MLTAMTAWAACPLQHLDPAREAIEPPDAYCFLEDRQHQFSPEGLLKDHQPFIPVYRDDLVFAANDSWYWVLIRLHNPAPREQLWFLQLDYAPLDHVEYFWKTAQGIQTLKSGDRRRFETRPVDYRYYLKQVRLEPGETKPILLRVYSEGAINIPLGLHQSESLVESTTHLTLMHGLFYGALLILTLFNAVLFLTTGASHYFYNAFYILSMGVFLFTMGGFAFQYFWPGYPTLANVAVPLGEALVSLSLVLFGRSFLEIDRHRPLSLAITRLLLILGVGNLVIALVTPYEFAIRWNTAAALGSIAAFFALGVSRWRDGFAPAKWYVLSWAALALGCSIYALAAFGYVSNFLANEAIMQLAVVAQVLLLNYALVLRVNFLNQRVLDMENEARHQLERQVRQRTRELEEAKESLEDANRKLAELSTRDQLTGLHNRRYFDLQLQEAFKESRRLAQPLTLMLVDVDHFKAVNDTHGHAVGDECLVHIARVLEGQVRRPRDTLARVGGEEFAIILPNTARAGALHVADELLVEIRQRPAMSETAGEIPLTFSVGLAIYTPQSEDSPQTLFVLADQALYLAKRNGRNRVELADVSTGMEPGS